MKMAVESMEMAPGAIPRPGRVPEQRLLSPETCLRWRWSYGTFHRWRLIDLGFSRREQYIGERAMSVGARRAHTMPRRGQGGPAPRGGVAASRLFSVSPFDSVIVKEK
jgi:hypothetical protein